MLGVIGPRTFQQERFPALNLGCFSYDGNFDALISLPQFPDEESVILVVEGNSLKNSLERTDFLPLSNAQASSVVLVCRALGVQANGIPIDLTGEVHRCGQSRKQAQAAHEQGEVLKLKDDVEVSVKKGQDNTYGQP